MGAIKDLGLSPFVLASVAESGREEVKMNETKPTADLAVEQEAGSDVRRATALDVHVIKDRTHITGDRTRNDRLLTAHHQHDYR